MTITKVQAFEALQNTVLDKKVLEDLSYLTKFFNTAVLEIYHSLYKKWDPKRQYFSYLGMLARSQLVIMYFNEGNNLEQATTKKGEKRYNVQFAKIIKSWSSKPIKKEKDRSYLHPMVKETAECVKKKERLKKPLVPDLTKNIASIPKPDKTIVIENQLSRFGNLIKNIFIFVCFIVFAMIYTVYFTPLEFVDLVFITFRIIWTRLWKIFPNLS